MTKVDAGPTGTFDPTEYFYDATTGLMTKVRYTSDTSTFDANYCYDRLARVTKITDWTDETNGLRYGYDHAGRLTSITDYDDSTLTYAYDAAETTPAAWRWRITTQHDDARLYRPESRLWRDWPSSPRRRLRSGPGLENMDIPLQPPSRFPFMPSWWYPESGIWSQPIPAARHPNGRMYRAPREDR